MRCNISKFVSKLTMLCWKENKKKKLAILSPKYNNNKLE